MNSSNIQQILSPRTFNTLLAFMAGLIFWLVMFFLEDATRGLPGSFFAGVHRFFQVWGGEGIGALIKITAYIACFYGILDLREKTQMLARENEGFRQGILPDTPADAQVRLAQPEMQHVRDEIEQRERRGHHFWVNTLVKKTASQYLNHPAVGDAMRMLDTQIETAKDEQEGQLEVVRYLIQTIPMLGFIGTIIELTSALAIDSKTGDYIIKVSSIMSSAFNATLVALALTILLTFRYHRFLEGLDTFFAQAKNYVLDNLIGRLR